MLHLVEIKKLVHKTQHAPYVPLYNVEHAPVLLADAFGLAQLRHRPGNHCQRRAELM